MREKPVVAIIGGSGFLGTQLTKHLLPRFKVRVIDTRAPPRNQNPNVETRICDILKLSDLESALEGVDFVIHSAIIQIPQINLDKRNGYEVNVLGTQNTCEIVHRSKTVRGMVLAGTWHIFGEGQFYGTARKNYNFEPEPTEERSRLYALCKIAQETILRIYDEISNKIFGVIRMGTILGEGMPRTTAANIFITNALEGKPLTPFVESRSVLYVSLHDICLAYESYIEKSLSGKIKKNTEHSPVIDFFFPEPVSMIDLAAMVRDLVVEHGKSKPPEITVMNAPTSGPLATGKPSNPTLTVTESMSFLNLPNLTNPREALAEIMKEKVRKG